MKILSLINNKIILTAAALAAAVLFSGCQHLKQNPDSVYEETIEDLIEHTLGIDLDITPNAGEEQGLVQGFNEDAILPNMLKKK